MSYFDDNEDWIVYGSRGRKRDDKPQDPRCKFCGSEDVRWRQQGGKWVLFSLEPGKLHVCPVADDFGVVK